MMSAGAGSGPLLPRAGGAGAGARSASANIGMMALSLLLLGLPPIITGSTTGHPTFYVSPTGYDASAGTIAEPFASLRRAQAAVRALAVRGGATVVLRAGVYAAGPSGEVPLQLMAEDGGSAEAGPVVWRAYEGEEATISGGMLVPFSPHPTLHGALQANLTALGLRDLGAVEEEVTHNRTRAELFYQRRPMILARWPNIGADGRPRWAFTGPAYPFNCTPKARPCCGPSGLLPCVQCNASMPVGCEGFSFGVPPGVSPPSNLGAWAAQARDGHAWVHGYFSEDFSDRYMNVTFAHASNATHGSLASPSLATGATKWGARFYALNFLAELDVPAEYFIERGTGLLHFIPPTSRSDDTGGSDDEAAGMGAFVSTAPFVVSLAANTSFIHFEGLRLEHSRSHAVAQPAGPKDANYWPSNPLALAAAGTIENITFRGCVVANTGGSGLVLDRCTACRVDDSEVHSVGSLAIRVSGGGHRTLRRSENVVANCSIHSYARWKRTYQPGLSWMGVGNSFLNNKIWEAPHQAVLGGGNEAVCGICTRDHRDNLQCHYKNNGSEPGGMDAACGGNDNLWEGNHFLNLTWETADSGAFYSCGQSGTGYTNRGNVVRNNVFENIRMTDGHPNQGAFGNMNVQAFYLDDTMGGWSEFDNASPVACFQLWIDVI
jgi:hypothetical protein